MSSWTSKQVVALAPDDKSAKAGQKLATPSKWSALGSDERAVWGACRGSGAKPYLVRIDLSEPAFKCSCPSRKFPCKHALALFFLFVEKPGALSQDAPPAWLTEWLAARDERQLDNLIRTFPTRPRVARIPLMAGFSQGLGLAAIFLNGYRFWLGLAPRSATGLQSL